MSAVLLCDDLLFASRITGTAKALGLELKCARSIPELTTLLITQSPTCVLVDLHHAGLSVADFVKNLPDPRPLVVGYGSHVDAPTLKGKVSVIAGASQGIGEEVARLFARHGSRVVLLASKRGAGGQDDDAKAQNRQPADFLEGHGLSALHAECRHQVRSSPEGRPFAIIPQAKRRFAAKPA